MKRYTVRNIRKAAQLALDATQCSENEAITLRLVSGIHGGLIREKHYRTVNGLLNSRHNVRCYFYRSNDGYSYRLMFEATN
jgi:hypothetical protein